MSDFPFRIWELICYVLILVIGVAGNGVVIIVILKSKKIERGNVTNVLIFTLALVDMAISVIGVPIYFLQSGVITPNEEYGNVVCAVIHFPQFWLLDVGMYILVFISLERKEAIVRPLSVLSEKSKLTVFARIFLCFIVAFLLQSPTLYGIRFKENSHSIVGKYCAYSYTISQSRIIYFVVLFFETLLPLFIILKCFWKIRYKLKHTDVLIRNSLAVYMNDEKFEAKKKLILSRKQNAFVVWQIVVLAVLVCIVPNNVLYCVYQFNDIKSLEWNSEIYQAMLFLHFSNSCINPFVYSFISTEFRRNVKDVFGIRCCSIKSLRGRRNTTLQFFKARKPRYGMLTNSSNRMN